jgi:hypothetical protein
MLESDTSYVFIESPPSPGRFDVHRSTSAPSVHDILSAAKSLEMQLQALEAQSNFNQVRKPPSPDIRRSFDYPPFQFSITVGRQRRDELKAQLEDLKAKEKHQKAVTKILQQDLARLKSGGHPTHDVLAQPDPSGFTMDLDAPVPPAPPPAPFLERMNTLKGLGKRLWHHAHAKKDSRAGPSSRRSSASSSTSTSSSYTSSSPPASRRSASVHVHTKKRSVISLRMRFAARAPAHAHTLSLGSPVLKAKTKTRGRVGRHRRASASAGWVEAMLLAAPAPAGAEAPSPQSARISKTTWKTALERRRRDAPSECAWEG